MIDPAGFIEQNRPKVNYNFVDEILPILTKKKKAAEQNLSDLNRGPFPQKEAFQMPGATSQNRPSIRQMSNKDAYALIQKYFPQNEWERAYNVMMGESGGRPDAVGDNYPIRGQTIPSYGYFQIRALPGRPAPDQLVDPEFNVRYAAQLWKSQGWSPWTIGRKLGYAK